MKGRSARGFFFLGIALFKMEYFDQAAIAFQKSTEIKPDDSQAHYNLGLCYFKDEKYSHAVEHLKICT